MVSLPSVDRYYEIYKKVSVYNENRLNRLTIEAIITYLSEKLGFVNETEERTLNTKDEAYVKISKTELYELLLPYYGDNKISDTKQKVETVTFDLSSRFIKNSIKCSKLLLTLKRAPVIFRQNNTIFTKEDKMTEFMYINPAMKNPKTGESVRDQETAKLEALKSKGNKIVGLEMTVADLAGICDKNIDPQHTEGKADECCAKAVAENAEKLLAEYKGQDVVFVTNRVDLDSVAAYVIADRYLQGQPVEYNDNLTQINDHDAHLGAKWEGPKPIEQAFNPDNKTEALASSIKVFMVTPKNIEDVKNFIDTGNVEESIMNNYRAVQNGIIDRVKSGEIKTEVVGGVAYVETTLPCATNVGYSMAPVVVAVNPAMKLGPQGEPFRKVSICQHETGYADLNAIAEKLNEMDSGWGGSPTFKGSKQGESCNISLSDIKKIVYTNLTPEYKAKVTSNTGNANRGKGMGK